MLSYYEKYLKYKNKYIALKNQSAGAIPVSSRAGQIEMAAHRAQFAALQANLAENERIERERIERERIERERIERERIENERIKDAKNWYSQDMNSPASLDAWNALASRSRTRGLINPAPVVENLTKAERERQDLDALNALASRSRSLRNNSGRAANYTWEEELSPFEIYLMDLKKKFNKYNAKVHSLNIDLERAKTNKDIDSINMNEDLIKYYKQRREVYLKRIRRIEQPNYEDHRRPRSIQETEEEHEEEHE